MVSRPRRNNDRRSPLLISIKTETPVPFISFQTNRIEIFHQLIRISQHHSSLSTVFPSNPIRFVSQKHMFSTPFSPSKKRPLLAFVASSRRRLACQRTDQTIPTPNGKSSKNYRLMINKL